MMEIVNIEKVKMLTFGFKKSNFDRKIYSNMFEFQENECRLMLRRLKLINEVKMVKSQNVDF